VQDASEDEEDVVLVGIYGVYCYFKGIPALSGRLASTTVPGELLF
jgi:hypothetical protein